MPVTCPKCHAPLVAESAFCGQCGLRLIRDTSANAKRARRLKPLHWVAIIVGGLFFLAFISALAGQGSDASSPTPGTGPAASAAPVAGQGSDTSSPSSGTEPGTTAAPVTLIAMSIDQLRATYDSNKLAADKQLKGRLIQVDGGEIRNISSTIFGKPYMSLEPPGYIGLWSLKCDLRDENAALELINGQSVTVRGTNNGMSLGIVTLKNCEVIK